MLRLAAQETAGAYSFFVPVGHTQLARSVLGERFLAVQQAVVLADSMDAARSMASEYLRRFLALGNYRENLRRFGWSDSDLENSGSPELFDELVAWGDAARILHRIRAHFDSGADHVVLSFVSPASLGGEMSLLARAAGLV
jgi:probable F420-dependent oxidoreductase